MANDREEAVYMAKLAEQVRGEPAGRPSFAGGRAPLAGEAWPEGGVPRRGTCTGVGRHEVQAIPSAWGSGSPPGLS